MPSAAGSKATAFGGAAPPGVRTSLAGEFQAGQREFLGPIEFSKAGGGDFLPACPYRKSNPDVLMAQTSEVGGGATILSDRTDEVLRMSVPPWRSRCDRPVLNAHRVNATDKDIAIDTCGRCATLHSQLV